jgi:hypothetical protein
MTTRPSKTTKKIATKKAKKKPPQNTRRATPEEIERIKKLMEGSRSERREAEKLAATLSQDDQTILMQWAVDKMKAALDLVQRNVMEPWRKRLEAEGILKKK